MRPRARAAVLLLAAAPCLAGDGRGPSDDPFEEVLLGSPGEELLVPVDGGFDAALSWSPLPRRSVVDRLAMEWHPGLPGAVLEVPPLPGPGTRGVAAPPGDRKAADPLALRLPADAAAVLFGSLREAEEAVDGLARFLPAALPDLCADPPGGRREALRRAVEMLLLPTIWRSNPGVRTGTRSVALVVSDPDVRWAPEIALVAEVDDASLVRFHRASTLSWEDRGRRPLRVEGLDATSDDGSIRSFFALEGGLAVWSTTASLRARILASASGAEVSLASSPGGEYAAARAAFPRAAGGALLVVPDGFAGRNSSLSVRRRRLDAQACEAARLVRAALAQRDPGKAPGRWAAFACPAGGAIAGEARAGSLTCSVHGSAEFPAPLSTLPDSPGEWMEGPGGRAAGPAGSREVVEGVKGLLARPDALLRGAVPVAARWTGNSLEALVGPGGAGAAATLALREWAAGGRAGGEDRAARRGALLAGRGLAADAIPGFLRRLTGLDPAGGDPRAAAPRPVKGPPPRSGGGVLVLSLDPGPVLAWRE